MWLEFVTILLNSSSSAEDMTIFKTMAIHHVEFSKPTTCHVPFVSVHDSGL